MRAQLNWTVFGQRLTNKWYGIPGIGTKKGFFRGLDLQPRKFTLHVDSTIETDPNEFCPVLHFDVQHWKGEFAGPEWKTHQTSNLATDLTEFQTVLSGFAQNLWKGAWLRYTIGNANGGKDHRATELILKLP